VDVTSICYVLMPIAADTPMHELVTLVVMYTYKMYSDVVVAVTDVGKGHT